MHKIGLAALLSFVLTGAPAVPAVASQGEGSERIVCKSQQKTGTRFRKSVCRTAGEWEKIREAARRTLSEDLQSRAINTCRDSPSNCH